MLTFEKVGTTGRTNKHLQANDQQRNRLVVSLGCPRVPEELKANEYRPPQSELPIGQICRRYSHQQQR
jgi:hypothetical protein